MPSYINLETEPAIVLFRGILLASTGQLMIRTFRPIGKRKMATAHEQ